MEIKTKFNKNDIAWVLNGTQAGKGKVTEIIIKIGYIQEEIVNVSLDKMPNGDYHVEGLYPAMAFKTEEEMTKELLRRINGGKY